MVSTSRRRFLGGMASLGFSPLLASWAAEIPKDLEITRIVGFDLKGPRPKMVGKNARKGIHGDSITDRMILLYTNQGVTGLGRYIRTDNPENLRELLGKNPFDWYQEDKPGMDTSPLGAMTMALWDLAGKILGKPVYELLGGKGPETVAVYDGSIYFADLLPQYVDRPMDRIKEEIDMGLAAGHRAFKIKIGRGNKWMPPEEGYDRDLEVLQTIRKQAGPEVVLGVDANNGYDLERTKRLLVDLPNFNFAFVEEMFPEDIELYRDLLKFIDDKGLDTLVADGENWKTPEEGRPFIEAGVIEVLQGDMKRFGFEGILREAEWGKRTGAVVAPHNWGSYIGFFMQLHVGRAIDNFYMAELDTCHFDALVSEGYTIRDGRCSVPDVPGFGLEIDAEKFSGIPIQFDLRV